MTLYRSLLAVVLGLSLAVTAFAEDAATQPAADQATPAMTAPAAESATTTTTTTTESKDSAAKADTSAAASDKVNINTADEKTLMKVKGIGKKRAKAIVAYREKNGNFKSVEDLAKVKGVGKAFVKKHADHLTAE